MGQCKCGTSIGGNKLRCTVCARRVRNERRRGRYKGKPGGVVDLRRQLKDRDAVIEVLKVYKDGWEHLEEVARADEYAMWLADKMTFCREQFHIPPERKAEGDADK